MTEDSRKKGNIEILNLSSHDESDNGDVEIICLCSDDEPLNKKKVSTILQKLPKKRDRRHKYDKRMAMRKKN